MHPNMPGQFKHLCRKFGENPDNTVVFITREKPGTEIPGVIKVEYKPPREPSFRTHRYIIGLERGILQGQEVWRVCKKLKEEGFVPDVIVTHPGWGDAMYVKDIFYDTPVLGYFEFYYRSEGGDVNFDPEDPMTEDDRARIRTKNAINLFNLEMCDWGISPTSWQQHLHPKEFRDRISIIHDGVDTDMVRPDPTDSYTIEKAGITLTAKDEVVTYVARNFEPYRGFPTAMRAFKMIQERRPNCHIIAIGADDVSYGKRPPKGTTYRKMYMEELKPDLSRLHFVGFVPYEDFLKILHISRAHLYLTYPFVLSWSSLESMAAECLLIASSTQPVLEVVEDGHNGLLVDFFSPEQVADRICEALEHPERFTDIRKNARKTIMERYALNKLLPLHQQLVEDLAARRFPPPAAGEIMKIHPPEVKWAA